MAASIGALVTSARARLAAAGVEPSEAAMDAALLARHALGWDLARFVAHESDAAPERFVPAYESLVARRARREPVSVIVGCREFWGLDFEVTPAVLAPRPETEIILETAIDLCAALRGPGSQPSRPGFERGSQPSGPGFQPGGQLLIDVGTGSGCLAVCLAREFPGASVVATDVSPAALEVAARNASRHGVGDRVAFVRTSLLDGLVGPAALIVSNPPYIPAGDIPGLPPEVREWEPRSALDGGRDGLDLVRALLDDAPRVLAPGGWLIMEFGFGQEDGVREAVAGSALALVEIRGDLQGIPRTLVASRKR